MSALGDMNEQATQDAVPETEPQKRKSRKNIRRQLDESIKQFDTLLASTTLKESKVADLLIEKTSLQKMLLQLDLDEKGDEQAQEVERLTNQHTADTLRLATLEQQNTELRRDASQVKTVTVPDPGHSKTRQQCDTLSASLKFLTRYVEAREQTAVRAIQQLPAEAASIVCDAVGINYREYLQYLMTYRTERDLLKVIEQAQVNDTPLLRFVRAALSVMHSLNLAAPRAGRSDARPESNEMTGEEKLRRAKIETGTLTPIGAVIGDFRPSVRTSPGCGVFDDAEFLERLRGHL